MRVLLKTLAGLLMAAPVCAQVNPNNHWVDAYTTQDGVYVPGHYATDPNYTNRDNYSTYPNVNPWTGQQGTIAPDNNFPNQPQQPGSVMSSRASGGDPIWVATMPVPYQYGSMQRRVLTPEEQAAREAARQARRERAEAMRQYRKQQAQVRNYQRKVKAEAKRKERAARKVATERAQ